MNKRTELTLVDLFTYLRGLESKEELNSDMLFPIIEGYMTDGLDRFGKMIATENSVFSDDLNKFSTVLGAMVGIKLTLQAQDSLHEATETDGFIGLIGQLERLKEVALFDKVFSSTNIIEKTIRMAFFFGYGAALDPINRPDDRIGDPGHTEGAQQ